MSTYADLVWFDPGVTTGVAVVSISPKWLNGKGTSDFATMKKAIKQSWFCQIGVNAREWDEKNFRARDPRSIPGRSDRFLQISKGSGPIRAGHAGNGEISAGGIEAVLSGEGAFGGGDLTFNQFNEIKQTVEMQNLLELWPDAAWGYEDFILRTNDRSNDTISPVRLFSMITFSELVRGSRARVPFRQQPSMAKTTATDARIKAAGLYRAGMPHATDAARHCATFFRRARADKELRAQAWPELF